MLLPALVTVPNKSRRNRKERGKRSEEGAEKLGKENLIVLIDKGRRKRGGESAFHSFVKLGGGGGRKNPLRKKRKGRNHYDEKHLLSEEGTFPPPYHHRKKEACLRC